MDIFMVLQILFDAVLLFGILFLFHYLTNQTQKKKEDSDILKSVQVQEIKENLQDLLLTLKQLGKEVSDNIQEQVREAEEKTEHFKKTVAKLQKDMTKVYSLAEVIGNEKKHLEDKANAIEIAKKSIPKTMEDKEAFSPFSNNLEKPKPLAGEINRKNLKDFESVKAERGVGFSSSVIKEVYRLADDSLAINEIVQKTKLSRAEVQLILNLRGNRFSTPN